MAPVPTEVLDADIKELKAEIKDIRSSIDVLKADVHRIDVGLAEFRGEMKTLAGVARWAVGLATGGVVAIVATLISGAFGAAWWASAINADVRNLGAKIDDQSKATDARFEKLEASIAKALGQAKVNGVGQAKGAMNLNPKAN
jgi:hypothetical protein